jgi:FMN-dependent NADH-azoreductase
MEKLLQIDSSGKGSMSATKPLTEYFVQNWKRSNPSGEVISRDLLTSEIPLVTPELVGAFYTPADKQSDAQRATLAVSDQLVSELFAADTYVFGVPMYNFSVPGVFKLYIDQIVRAGQTFSYEGGYPQGLLKGKRLIVVTASGVDYSVPPMKELNFLEPYLRSIFGFLGVRDIEFVTISGRDPESVAAASEMAKKQIDKILSAEVAVAAGSRN